MLKIYHTEYSKIFQNLVVKRYDEEKISITNLVKILGVSARHIKKILSHNNIEIRENRKNAINEKYFDDVNTDNSSDVMYWLGFIAADGNVMNNPNKRQYYLTVNLKQSDKEHLLKLIYCLSSTSKIRDTISIEREYNGRHYNESKCSRVVFHSKHMVNSLEKFNIVPNKSLTLTFPTILKTHSMIASYIRGFCDGDGSINTTCSRVKKNGEITAYPRINFYGTLSFLTTVSEVIATNTGISNKIPYKNRTIHCLSYSCSDAIALMQWMYQDNGIFLKRKYELACKWIT